MVKSGNREKEGINPVVSSASEEASSQADEEWIAQLAGRICERRLGVPAIFFFESLRPLNFVASQSLHALAPLASLLVDPAQWEKLASALEDRRTIDRLLCEIEKKERERSTAR